MIENITQIAKEKHFNCKCDKCSKTYEKIVREEDVSIGNDIISNTEKTFCNNCIEEFKDWLRTKKYLKTDCWCKHIEEYKNR